MHYRGKGKKNIVNGSSMRLKDKVELLLVWLVKTEMRRRKN